MTDIFEAEAALRAQANEMVARLQLSDRLARIGQPVRVGSSALGLMVRPDIDITTICAQLDAGTLAAVAALGGELMTESMVVEAVRFRNDTGGWNKEPEAYPDGLYLGVTAQLPQGPRWTFDLWFVDRPERQPDLRHIETLLPRLTEASRASILGIKLELAAREDAARPTSALVYEAVMEHGVRSVGAFDDWMMRRRS